MIEPTVAVETAEPPAVVRSPGALVLARLRRDAVGLVSGGVIVFMIALAFCAPLVAHLTGHGPNDQDLIHGLSPDGLPRGPSWNYLFGTDDLGRDVLVRVAYGARISLLVGVVATGLAMAAGVALGLVAGFYG